LLQAAIMQGALAALLGARLGLSRWWWPINLVFVPALVALRDHSCRDGCRWRPSPRCSC